MTEVAFTPGAAALMLFGSFFLLLVLRVPVAFALLWPAFRLCSLRRACPQW